MKKKIVMVCAGLGLCASMMMFNAQEANATKDPNPEWECWFNYIDMDCCENGTVRCPGGCD